MEGFLEEPVYLAMPWLLGGVERKPRRLLVLGTSVGPLCYRTPAKFFLEAL